MRHRQRATEIFPELEPAEGTGASRRRTSTFAEALQEMRVQFLEVLENPDATNPLARLLVYSLNLVLLILAFPVGFAMLILNILGGANLRTTVHVLALTGVAIALVNTETGARLLGLG
jgi:hypothetical protein